ncbi:MAG TPA: tripartite tricarboxylate transporter TctB family protein [Candidatus Binatia bacterium]|jgi:putative tricarboxylic transport membrane protein|nr:tripartite tricarboxylate transporter TctB family protein [Candidatus Binatia bacterium]
MKRSQLAVSTVLAGLAGFVLLESRHLSFGTMRVPQTGFFPWILATLLLILCVILFAQGFFGAESDRRPDNILPEGWSRIAFTLAAMIGFALVLERLGFLLTTFFLMILLLRAVESQRWSKVFFVAVLTAIASYAIFGWILGIPLPGGILGI